MQSPIPGWSLLLEGAPGAGKTYTFLTVRDLHKRLGSIPFELGVLSLDKNVRPQLGAWCDSPKEGEGICKIKTVSFQSADADPFSAFEAMLGSVNTLGNDSLQKISGSRDQYKQMLSVIATMRRFIADDGTDWGTISKWPSNRILLIDGLSGLTYAAQHIAVGNKPALTQPDYQVIGNTLKEFLTLLLYNVSCHVCLISHIEKEDNPLGGPGRLYPSTLGKKLGPVVGKDFSDIILQQFKGGKWTWSTMDDEADLKAGHVPVQKDMTPSIQHLFSTPEKGWLAKGGLISTEVAKR